MNYHLIVETSIKLFFMLTPFFVLSMFFTITADMTHNIRVAVARRALFSITFVCLILFFFGRQIFSVFGITVDSFRIGAGVILLLTAIEQVRGTGSEGVKRIDNPGDATGLAIVPLTIPYVVGPGTIGMLLVLGGETLQAMDRISMAIGIVLACVLVGSMLCFSENLQRFLSHRTLQILSKITGLVLAALSAQSMMDGVRQMLGI